MKDLLQEMASDSGSTNDKLDRLKDDQLDSISKLANDAAVLEEMISTGQRFRSSLFMARAFRKTERMRRFNGFAITNLVT